MSYSVKKKDSGRRWHTLSFLILSRVFLLCKGLVAAENTVDQEAVAVDITGILCRTEGGIVLLAVLLHNEEVLQLAGIRELNDKGGLYDILRAEDAFCVPKEVV